MKSKRGRPRWERRRRRHQDRRISPSICLPKYLEPGVDKTSGFIFSAWGQWVERAMIVTTTNDLAGYRIVRTLGVAKGLTVRSRSVVGNIGAAIQILFGGNITVYTKLAEQTRQEAFDLLIQNAEQMGANAILAFRYDANEIASAVTEVLAYGTAVVVEPIS